MAAQAPEAPPVAHRARRLIELCGGTAMRFEKIRRVVCGPELRPGAVAELATKRQLDLAVAHQAVRHLGHVCTAHRIRCVDAAMAGQACVRAVELPPNVTCCSKVLAGIDGL